MWTIEKAGGRRAGSGREKGALSFSLPDPARSWSRSSPARFFDRPHWPRAWNRLSEITQKSGGLGLGTNRNVSGVSNASLQQHCDGTFFSILLFVFSAIKGPAKDYHLWYVRNTWTKYFYHFQGLRVLKCHWTKHSNHVNYRSTNHGRNDPCRRLFPV